MAAEAPTYHVLSLTFLTRPKDPKVFSLTPDTEKRDFFFKALAALLKEVEKDKPIADYALVVTPYELTLALPDSLDKTVEKIIDLAQKTLNQDRFKQHYLLEKCIKRDGAPLELPSFSINYPGVQPFFLYKNEKKPVDEPPKEKKGGIDPKEKQEKAGASDGLSAISCPIPVMRGIEDSSLSLGELFAHLAENNRFNMLASANGFLVIETMVLGDEVNGRTTIMPKIAFSQSFPDNVCQLDPRFTDKRAIELFKKQSVEHRGQGVITPTSVNVLELRATPIDLQEIIKRKPDRDED